MPQAGIKSAKLSHCLLIETADDKSAAAAIILLSFVLALGFLLVILGCALFGQWLPLLVGKPPSSCQLTHVRSSLLTTSPRSAAATFLLAPLPNLLASTCSYGDEFSAEYSSAPGDAAKFFTGGLIATGVAMPLAMAHSCVPLLYPRQAAVPLDL